jgi:hypothetical protein
VTQESNSRETVFCSDGNVVGSALQGVISVQSADDDDFIGFAFGYAPGDNNNPNADYLLFGKTERMMHLFLADFEWHVFLNSVSFNIYIYIGVRLETRNTKYSVPMPSNHCTSWSFCFSGIRDSNGG